MLVERFYELGKLGIPSAIAHYRGYGLSYACRKAAGIALQILLEQIDQIVVERELLKSHAHFYIGNVQCRAIVDGPCQKTFIAVVTPL